MKYRLLKIWSIVQSIGKFNTCIAKNLKPTKFTQRCTVQGGGMWYMTRLLVDLIEAVCFPSFRTGNSKLQVYED